jgi:hypothetical protein
MVAVTLFATRRAALIAAVIAAVSGIATAIAIAVEPRRALLGYLAAYSAVVAVAAGALILLLISHATNARWLAPPRRLIHALTAAFPLLIVLFVPIALGLEWIYPWASPESLSEHERHLVEAKQPWLEQGPFIIRGFVYLLVFAIGAELLRRWSRERDRVIVEGDPEDVARRERRFSSGMLIPVGLAVTFAAFDWLMSLQPAWISTMFGVYYFAGGFSAAIALVSILGARLLRRTPDALTGHHFHALGRMLFAFVVFWAYTAYFQGFLIQIADRPNEVTFYIVRLRDGWTAVLWAMLLARFVLPFFWLLPRTPKHQPGYVAAISVVVIAGHLFDAYWLVVPVDGAAFAWPELAAFTAVISACVAFCAWRAHGLPIAAAGDPFLAAGRRYESPT